MYKIKTKIENATPKMYGKGIFDGAFFFSCLSRSVHEGKAISMAAR